MPGKPQIHFEGEMCEECGINPKRKKGYNSSGNQRYDKHCTSCHRGQSRAPWILFRKESCEQCGYTPMFIGSLDVHHRDGDKSNDDEFNLMTVCATCHRELTAIIRECAGDWEQGESLFKRFIKALIS